ncbi:MAG: hypothetical protein H6828_00460 [Planctomycetes bacterium]|nr:hypothetical protein [Planctomycetota bacterium]
MDVRALVTLVAEASGFELETVAVGRFEEAPFPRLDDAIARAEVSLSGHASPQQLADLVELLTRLGYLTTVLDVRMHRSSTDAARFEQQVTLGLHQSIPVPASHTESGSGTEIPKRT